MKYIYNGPQSKAAQFFIEQIEARLEKRPWSPADEVSVIRALTVTMKNFNIKVWNEIIKDDFD